MTLSVDIRLRRGSLELDVAFEARADETLALVGPNGSGKSTCLAAIAGLLEVDEGRVALGSRVWDAGPTGEVVPPAERGVGVVFQDPLLFEHQDVLGNVAFAARRAHPPRRAARDHARRRLRQVGVPDELDTARPTELSGGQAQRVALARALASDPSVLLLDEPLAAVDASSRIELRRELRDHVRGFAGPRVVVAHDAADVFGLADRIVVLEGGRVVQSGAPDELVSRPRSAYVADLVGVNRLEGTCAGGRIEVGGSSLTVASPLSGEVVVTVHPRSVSLYPAAPEGSPRNVWQAPVLGVESLGDRARVSLGGDLAMVAEVTHASVQKLKLGTGVRVWVAVKATEIGVGPR